MTSHTMDSIDGSVTSTVGKQTIEGLDTHEKNNLSPVSAEIPRKSHTGFAPPMSPMSWQAHHVNRRRKTNSIDLDDYFVGPRDVSKHSKWPFFMRLHGSILPKMILPLTFIAGWSTAITLISHYVYPLTVDSLLLTVLGFVVGLGLSFRSSTAYERFTEGRKYWAQLQFTAQNLSRVYWVNGKERPGEEGKQDLLGKLTALNLINAFAVSLKHKLRFEPGIHHEDLRGLVGYIDSFAKAAEETIPMPKQKTPWKATGEYLGISFAESNPRKYIKRANAKKPIGNLPLEVLKYLTAYNESLIENGTLPVPGHQTIVINSIVAMNEVMTGCERVLNTPMPLAYNICISQITWVYVLCLPFQLWAKLKWVTIPGCIFSAYIILGLAMIGREIENPFGSDVNDLPLDDFCNEIAEDIDIITAAPPPKPVDFIGAIDNLILWPLSDKGSSTWSTRSKEEIREALMTKANANLKTRKSVYNQRTSDSDDDGHIAAQAAPTHNEV
ncbi:UPF0187-domain-containing protein [Pseudovirgaria hyperparasitica]|uniref:UPF0187-domain-containing protein n=1 Tax=Pseudovirgaria hyperparasitica TaxID=470096 RepID=A0A6A6WLZ8_9PEZI|nr:UPF0187-domain-containing protein [Pseudovirgaria hyperparasitica]KAF2763178.1 UPF0187-domain-containing protein [Pseudovirgaria hyperparasitica]